MKLSRRGITRLVILTKKYAIKFPRFDFGWRLFIEGIRANLNEREFWMIANIPGNELHDRALPHICPIIWSSPMAWIIVMPRCENVGLFGCPTQLVGLVGDLKSDNCGWYDGRVVMFDYGSTNIDKFENQQKVIYS